MIFNETPLQGSFLVDLETRSDERGFFARFFCEREFASQGLNTRWVQINNSLTNEAATLRGLHFQRPPKSEVKVVRCLQGAIWDVIVDLRAASKTYSQWFGTELNNCNRTMMYVPKGFAHGFITLQPYSEILYLVSDCYSPEHEETLIWDDASVGIEWPIKPLLISDKDRQARRLTNISPIQF